MVSNKNILWKPDRDQNIGIKQIKEYIDSCNLQNSVLLMGIYIDDIHIGNLKYENINDVPSVATVGIMIGNKEYRGKGLAKEIINEGNKIISKRFGIKYIELRVYKWNKLAQKAYIKTGFKNVENGLIIDKHPQGQIMRMKT